MNNNTGLTEGDIIEIVWDDATGESCWVTREEVEWPLMEMKTLGYYWQENDKAVMVMGSLCEDYKEEGGTCGSLITIPKGMITKIHKLS